MWAETQGRFYWSASAAHSETALRQMIDFLQVNTKLKAPGGAFRFAEIALVGMICVGKVI